MKIWTFHCYATLPEHGQMTRHYNFGKQLAKLGHEPVVFTASHPHNTDLQLMNERGAYQVYQEAPFPWVLVKTNAYKTSKIKRLISLLEYPIHAVRAAKQTAKRYGKPDVIIGSSSTPLVALLGVRLARKYGAKAVVEIRDLWPESLVSYGVASARSPIIRAMRRLEKWLYKHADAVVFLMDGAYDYIREQGWEQDVPREKVYFVNNGVDLEQYDQDCEQGAFPDADLDDPDTYKVVYTGSLRKANASVLRLLDVARHMQDDRVRFLIYGKGVLERELRETAAREGLKNIILKGEVSKMRVPYVLSRCDLNVLNCEASDVLRFGGCQNKLFEYFASGHPTISGESPAHCLVATEGCGIAQEFCSAEELCDAILELKNNPPDPAHVREIAKKYDFRALTQQLLRALS